MGTAIPEASRAILKQWQAMGLRFDWCGTGDFGLRFDSGDSSEYVILEQPIPEGVTVDQVRAMWEQGLKIIFKEYRDAESLVSEGFLWYGGFSNGLELLSRMRIPGQPIPEKMLQESVAELPKEECALSDMIWNSPQPTRFKATMESDPSGLDPHAPGAKLDAGKSRLGLVLGGFARALEKVGKVGTYGAEKYSPNGWKEVEKGAARYDDAMLRHWFKRAAGEAIDPETGLLHQAQVAWNALAVLEVMLEEFDG